MYITVFFKIIPVSRYMTVFFVFMHDWVLTPFSTERGNTAVDLLRKGLVVVLKILFVI